MTNSKNTGLRGLVALIASAPIVPSTASCERSQGLDYSRNPPLERQVDYKEQLADELNATLRHWQSTPSYEVAKKWLVGYEAPELPNSFAYFVVRETGLVASSRVKIEDQGSNGVRIELDYAYAQGVLAEAGRRDAQRYLNTGNFGGFP